VSELLERLDYPADTKAVIIVCDGLGSSNAANIAIKSALRHGLATCAGLQVPCPWALAATAQHEGEDVGVALTLTAEYDLYRWGPITQAPSLLGGDGGFPQTPVDCWEHADIDEVRRETRAQLERAVLWGFHPSHLGSHMDVLNSRPEFFDVYLDLALEFGLPISLPDPALDLGFDPRRLAADEGVLVPDRVVRAPRKVEARSIIDAAIADLEPGVTEIHIRPAIDSPELRAMSPDWLAAVSNAHLITEDWVFRSALARSGAKLIGFAQLQQAQRNGS